MKDNLGNIMVDIEALGRKTDSVIISICAIEFDLNTGETNRIFYEKCNIQSCLDAGLKVDGDTISWWMKQDDKSRLEVVSGTQSLSNMLFKFTNFIQELKSSNLCIWGNSNRFDMGLLESSYTKLKKNIPWKFSLERDVRTLVSFSPNIKKEMEFIGTKHYPVDDCLHQIKYCTKIWNTLNNNL
jgi:hypothetical protein